MGTFSSSFRCYKEGEGHGWRRVRLRPWKTERFTFNQHQNLVEVRWNWFKIHDLINALHSIVLTTGIIKNNIDISYTVVWTRSTHVLSPDIMHVYITNTKDDFDFLALLSSDDCSTSVSHCLNHYLLNHVMKFESWWFTIIHLVECTCSQAHSMHFLVRAHTGYFLVASILF